MKNITDLQAAPLADNISLLSILCYSFLIIPYPKIAKFFLVLSLIIFLFSSIKQNPVFFKNTAFLFLAAAITIPVINWAYLYLFMPDWNTEYPRMDRIARLFEFIIIAWILKGSHRNLSILWICITTGFLITPLINGTHPQWIDGINGQRIDFDIRNAQFTAMFFGTFSIILSYLVYYNIQLPKNKFKKTISTILSLLLIICIIGVIITQTRAIWLALAVCAIFACSIFLISAYKQGRTRFTLSVVTVVVLSIISAFYFSFIGNISSKRIKAEDYVIEEILEGNIANIPYSSIGIRIHTWRAAIEKLNDSPIFGLGANARHMVISETSWLPQEIKEKFGHLHNYYLEILVSYGIIGIAFLMLFSWWLIAIILKAWKTHSISAQQTILLTSLCIYWIIINNFESYNSFSYGIIIHNFIVATIITMTNKFKIT